MDERLRSLRDLVAAYATNGVVDSVAVVGNAPMVVSRERARRIDSADLVIRMNSFVTDDDEPCQGGRTDVVLFSRLVPATPDFWRDYGRRLYVLLEPMRMYGRPEMWPTSWPRDAGFVVARNDSVAIPLNEEIGLPWRQHPLAPTTGTTAVWLARQLFPGAHVCVAGISFVDQPEQTTWQHQWGDSVGVGPEHRITAEARLLARLQDEGSITMLPLGGED